MIAHEPNWILKKKKKGYRNNNDDLCQGSKTPLLNQINGHFILLHLQCYYTRKVDHPTYLYQQDGS